MHTGVAWKHGGTRQKWEALCNPFSWSSDANYVAILLESSQIPAKAHELRSLAAKVRLLWRAITPSVTQKVEQLLLAWLEAATAFGIPDLKLTKTTRWTAYLSIPWKRYPFHSEHKLHIAMSEESKYLIFLKLWFPCLQFPSINIHISIIGPNFQVSVPLDNFRLLFHHQSTRTSQNYTQAVLLTCTTRAYKAVIWIYSATS